MAGPDRLRVEAGGADPEKRAALVATFLDELEGRA